MTAGRVWSFLVILLLFQQQATCGQNEDINTQMKKREVAKTRKVLGIGEELYPQRIQDLPLMFTSSEEQMILEQRNWRLVVERLYLALNKSFGFFFMMLVPQILMDIWTSIQTGSMPPNNV